MQRTACQSLSKSQLMTVCAYYPRESCKAKAFFVASKVWAKGEVERRNENLLHSYTRLRI